MSTRKTLLEAGMIVNVSVMGVSIQVQLNCLQVRNLRLIAAKFYDGLRGWGSPAATTPPPDLPGTLRLDYTFKGMYDDFKVKDRWSGQDVHCMFQAIITAISTRHADAVDVKFLATGRAVWIALPHAAWGEYNRRSGKIITDPLAAQIAGHFLKSAIESGEEDGREMYNLTVAETLQHLDAVVQGYATVVAP